MTTQRFRHLAVALLGVTVLPLGLVACGNDSSDGADPSTTAGDPGSTASAPKVTDAWARPGTAGGNTAVYMTITGGAEATKLVKVELPSGTASSVELHETSVSGSGSSTTMKMDEGSEMGGMDQGSGAGSSMSGGMMGMKAVDAIEVPADGTVELKPGGYHVMVMDLQKDLTAGESLPVTLTFEPGGTVEVTATVREP